MPIRFTSIAAAVAMALAGSAACADGLEDILELRGYGTFALTHSDEDQADFVTTNIGQPEGAGYSDAWSPHVDSKLAFQIDAKFSEKLTGVVQIISESAFNSTLDGDPNEQYVPSIEWANLKYQFNDNFSVRAGRIVLPTLMNVEFRKVGYAQHWMRPSVEVYSNLPFASNDGMDFTFKKKLGPGTNSLTGHYGYTHIRAGGFKSQVKQWGIVESYEIGALTLRGAYLNVTMQSVKGTGLDGLFVGLSGLAAMEGDMTLAGQAAALVPKYGTEMKRNNTVMDIGFTYDPGQYFLMGEAVRTTGEGMFGSFTGAYLSGGYRFGSLTPFATYGKLKTDVRHDPLLDLSGVAPNGLAGGLGGVVNGLIANMINGDGGQSTASVGLRWDFAKNLDLKAQYDYIDLVKGGQLANTQAGFVPGGSVNVFAVSVDFVF